MMFEFAAFNGCVQLLCLLSIRREIIDRGNSLMAFIASVAILTIVLWVVFVPVPLLGWLGPVVSACGPMLDWLAYFAFLSLLLTFIYGWTIVRAFRQLETMLVLTTCLLAEACLLTMPLNLRLAIVLGGVLIILVATVWNAAVCIAIFKAIFARKRVKEV